MSDVTDLEEIAQNIRNRLKEITAKPKPSYDIEGQQVKWQEYFDSLMKNLSKVNDQLAAADPYEHRTQGFS